MSAPPPLDGAEIQIWTVDLDQPDPLVAALRADLPPDERARADRFHFARDRRRFCVAHAALRAILGRHLGQPPAEVALRSGTYGKPALGTSRSPIEFNLSHAGEYALVALTLGAPLGVDIEQIRPIDDIRLLAAHTFSPAELALLERCPPDQYDQAFFNCWTRKEAVIKALGLGLHCPLDSFDVACLPGEPARILRAPPGDEQWTLAELAAPAGYAAAVVVAGPPRRIVHGNWAVEE
jgi:4'-phosphopantetheinyl transferase